MRYVFAITGLTIIFSLCITACKKDKSAQVQACFTYSHASVEIGQPDSFFNCSKNAEYYKWYFGDGDSDIVDTWPVHTYALPGNYTVKMLAFDQNGKQSSDTQHIVAVLPSITSSVYTGTYSGTEVCSLTGTDTMSITITTSGYFGLNIFNLYGTGNSFYASIDSLNGTIAPQNFTGGSSGNGVLQGTLLLSSNHDSIFLSLIETSFSQRNNCNAVFVR